MHSPQNNGGGVLHIDRQSTLIEIPYRASLQGAKFPAAMRFYSILFDLWTLTKPEINFMIAMATFTGFCLGRADQAHPFSLSLALRTIIGTVFIASGTGTLNQYVERQFDAQMRRTARRPLAAGRLNPSVGFVFGITMAVIGGAYLAVAVNLLASALAGITMLLCLLIYTPLKRKSPVCTLIGALSGAMPLLIGRAGATGKSKLWGVGPLRDSLSLAISPFHGDRMVVPRRLRESGLLCIASHRQA
jgi:heme O synthase-like polyprenyltransferase